MTGSRVGDRGGRTAIAGRPSDTGGKGGRGRHMRLTRVGRRGKGRWNLFTPIAGDRDT